MNDNELKQKYKDLLKLKIEIQDRQQSGKDLKRDCALLSMKIRSNAQQLTELNKRMLNNIS